MRFFMMYIFLGVETLAILERHDSWLSRQLQKHGHRFSVSAFVVLFWPLAVIDPNPNDDKSQ